MKRIILASAGIFFLGVASCGSDAKVMSGTAGTSGGTAGTGGSGTGGSGTGGSGTSGTTGTGGDATGGTTGTGGDATGGTGGSSAGGKGGSAAGAAGSSGSGGSAGSAAGSGGSGTGGRGGAGGTAGSGAGGTGGSGTGGRGGSGTGGTGTGGAGGNLLSVAAAWDGQLVTYPCGSSGTGYDCDNGTTCPGAGTVTKTNTWAMAGTAATVYNVTFNVRGIVEAYAYVGGTRDGGSITSNLDLFQRGGMPQSAGGVNYDYNTYELDIAPGVTGEPNTYFLNSVTSAEGPHASNTPTSHLTFPINYTKTIKVMGNSVVTLKVFDSNCKLVQNCGATSGNTCAAPRTVSLTGVMPAAPTTFMQPFQMPTGKYGQWVFFDVTDVTVN